MDTPTGLETTTPTTVSDYAAAVERMGGGQFTTRYVEAGRKYFASLYGSPFFAIAQLAPEVQGKPNTSLLISDPSGLLATDGGRWLSLYSRAQTSTGRYACTVCILTRPRTTKPPKPILFQPPQQVLVKRWGKHIGDLDAPPDILILYVHEGFEVVLSTIDDLCQTTPHQKALIACDSEAESLIVRRLLKDRRFETSDIINFGMSDTEAQKNTTGAWWFSAITPPPEELTHPEEAAVAGVRDTYKFFQYWVRLAKSKAEIDQVVWLFAKRMTTRVGGQADVDAVRLSRRDGICLTTGRFFSGSKDAGEPEEFTWGERVLSPDVLAEAPKTDERLPLMAWLARAMTDDGRREIKELVEPVDVPVSESQLHEQGAARSETVPAPEASEGIAPALAEAPVSKIFAATTRPARSRLSRSAGTVNVLALAALLGKAGQSNDTAFDVAKRKILAWMSSKGFTGLEPAGNHHVELPDGEVSIETDNQSIWSMRFDDRRSMEDGAIWRVEATLLGNVSPAISVRLAQVRSSEDAPPPVAGGVPTVVATIAKEVGLQDAGVPLLNSALHLKGSSDADKLSRLLLNPHRTQPVIAIAGKVDASADRLAARLSGVAHVVCIDSELSDTLIRNFGRDLSVYGSAVRLYRPGFTAGADPYQHPIWTLKGTQLPKWLANDIFEEACAISLDAGDLEERAPSFQLVRNHLAELRIASSKQRIDALRAQAESMASSADEQINGLQAIRSELEVALDEYRNKNEELLDQAKQLQGELQVTRRERDEALEEARQLRYLASNHWADDIVEASQLADESYYPDNWDELELWVEEYGEGRLVLHPKAAKAARESPFKDIPLAYKAMEYLVRYYIPMRTRDTNDTGAYQRSKQALDELGLEESDVGTAQDIKRYKKEYRRQYDGEEIKLDRHLKSGVGFGGDFQFRLYFYYDEDAAKVVIGHMPTHLTNRLTHNG